MGGTARQFQAASQSSQGARPVIAASEVMGNYRLPRLLSLRSSTLPPCVQGFLQNPVPWAQRSPPSKPGVRSCCCLGSPQCPTMTAGSHHDGARETCIRLLRKVHGRMQLRVFRCKAFSPPRIVFPSCGFPVNFYTAYSCCELAGGVHTCQVGSGVWPAPSAGCRKPAQGHWRGRGKTHALGQIRGSQEPGLAASGQSAELGQVASV